VRLVFRKMNPDSDDSDLDADAKAPPKSKKRKNAAERQSKYEGVYWYKQKEKCRPRQSVPRVPHARPRRVPGALGRGRVPRAPRRVLLLPLQGKVP